jgi:hypothetical protein
MSMPGKKLFIVIGCDTDPDRQDFIENISGDKLSWRGMTEGIPETKSAVSDITDSNGKSPVFTWLMRADEQIKIIYGDYNSVLEENKIFIRELESSGDEIGWHPHFYRYNQKQKLWYQELNDIDWQCEVLESAYNLFHKSIPGRPVSVRTGWIYHNNSTLKKLDQLGIKIDFSAAPGLKTNPPKNKSFPYNIYDWFITGREPYYPSVNDYRRAARKGESSLTILEAPNFQLHLPFVVLGDDSGTADGQEDEGSRANNAVSPKTHLLDKFDCRPEMLYHYY